MEKDAVTVYCPNELCQAANPVANKFCQQCSTPIPQRYLWGVGEGKSVGNPGEILGDRYYVVKQSILLDCKPGLLPQIPDLDHLQTLRPYLRLFPYRLHVPQVYGVLWLEENGQRREIILLEKPPLQLRDGHTEVLLHPSIDTVWGQASSMRQLHWLWQIAQLWQPLASEGVVSSLLDPLLLRMEGGILRILELRADGEKPPNLAALGEFWRVHLLHKCQQAIANFVEGICQSLATSQIHSGEQLVAVLDQGLQEIGRHQSINVEIITQTDTGPQRQRNEDACYPPSGTRFHKPPQSKALAIVCDGIGGHEGGNVASNLAIETIQTQVQELTDFRYDHIDPNLLLADLEATTGIANDKISQRNDSEQRSGRQRMGTTLVMALGIAHEMYITHVGDSRAYLITQNGCYQVTIDDDVASREVRLGYALYHDAVSQPASGSLVQALGMGSSNSLHPTAQRFIVDEDCVFLLCSDGLSDFDRVEQNWETEILPIINENKDIGAVISKLVEIANTQNGHDNVTVAIVRNQVNYAEPSEPISPQLISLAAAASNEYKQSNVTVNLNPTPSQRTQVLPDTVQIKSRKIPFYLLILPVFLLLTGAVYWVISSNLPGSQTPLNSTSTKSPRENPLPSEKTTPGEANSLPQEILPGFEVKTKTDLKFNLIPANPTISTPSNSTFIPKGTRLRVLKREAETASESSKQTYTLTMKICDIPQSADLTPAPTSISTPSSGETTFSQISAGGEVLISSDQLTLDKVSSFRPVDPNQSPCSKFSLPTEEELVPKNPVNSDRQQGL